MKKKISVIILLAVLAAAGGYVSGSGHSLFAVMAKRAGKAEYTVCIDSGHGGNDPGKIGVAGTREKELNLVLALKLKESLEKEKIHVVMTRTDDRNLAVSGADSEKRSDMEQRVKKMDAEHPDAVISIHQNSYTDSSAKGAQVFYYDGSEDGQRLAEVLQETLIREVDESNRRMAKANSSYYILKNTSAPTVIVECGFLSNAEEEALLNTTEYQNQIVKALTDGVLVFLNGSEQT